MAASAQTPDRPYDIVLFGATGFTGGLTADYLAAHAPDGLRWALAGRNPGKLEAVLKRVAGGVCEPEILTADVTDAPSLQKVAEAARVVITTVGPYLEYGEPLVRACAAAGTDYLDLAGEPEFVDRMYLSYHEAAERSGARIVHACGFDSIPHDLGVQYTVDLLPEGVPIAVCGYVTTRGVFSGGTFASALGAMARLRQANAAHRERRSVEPEPTGGRRVRAIAGRPRFDRNVDRWVLPMPTIDPQIVVQSAAALARYGPDFSYSHLAAFKNPVVIGAAVTGMGLFVAAAQVPPLRPLILKVRPSGAGPTKEQIDKGWFRVRFVGEGGGERVVTQVSGGDPGYGDTSKMLAESALCLAFDDLPKTAGMVTTAVAMGPALRTRIEAAGITFETLES